MLRKILWAAVIVCVVATLISVVIQPSFGPLLVMSLVVLIGIAFEYGRYGAATTQVPIEHGWQPTPERFIDETGQPVRVWFNPASGERRYVADDSAPGQRE